MSEYPKIHSVYKRDPDTNYSTFLLGEYSLPEFEYLAENGWIFTEKVDGTNIRVIVEPDCGGVEIRGKTDKAEIPPFLQEALDDIFNPAMRDLLYEQFPDGGILYGEGYGPKIQKGGLYRDDNSFVLFDVRVGKWWLQRDVVGDVGESLGLDVVPVIGHGTLDDALCLAADGFESEWGDFIAEGVVAQPAVGLLARSGERVITKIKHRDFV